MRRELDTERHTANGAAAGPARENDRVSDLRAATGGWGPGRGPRFAGTQDVAGYGGVSEINLVAELRIARGVLRVLLAVMASRGALTASDLAMMARIPRDGPHYDTHAAAEWLDLISDFAVAARRPSVTSATRRNAGE